MAGIGNMLTLSLFDPAGSRGAGHRGGANHLVVITTGDLERNRELVSEHGLRCPVLLKQGMEIASRYQAHGTPTGYLLDEGTAKHTGPEIAEAIENAGGSLELSSSGGAVRVLSPDRSLGLGLLLECLTQPSFPKEACPKWCTNEPVSQTTRRPEARTRIE